MERQRNWLGWAALAIGSLALLMAFAGFFKGPGRMGYGYAPAAPQAPAAPRFERGQAVPFADELEREQARPGRGDQFAPGFHGRGDQFAPGFHGRGEGFQGHERGFHGFGPLGLLFGLVNFLTKLAALGLLAWLLLRLFQQRRDQPPPATPGAPLTPAGHDPRVE